MQRADLRRHELPLQRHERGLPLPERLDAARSRRGERLPVLVYFYGGGFVAGDGSEPRYDGESMARKGIVALTVNYRLGVFGFFAHPELTEGIAAARLRQLRPARPDGGAAVGAEEHRGVRRRPEAGHDRRRIGRVDLGQRADGVAAVEGPDRRRDRRERRDDRADAAAGAARRGGAGRASKFADERRRDSPGGAARDAGRSRCWRPPAKPGARRFPPTVDGYFLPKAPVEIFAAGEQAHVPLLVGWNSEEMGARARPGGRTSRRRRTSPRR